MNARRIPLFAAAASLLVAHDLYAQGPTGFCELIYPTPVVGHYAEFRASDTNEGSVTLRFAVVAQEKVVGKPHYWIEIRTAAPAAERTVIAQVLVPRYPFDLEDIKGYIVKLPGQPAMRVPQEVIEETGTAEPGFGWGQACETAEEMGTEQLAVTGSTFRTRHFRWGGDKSGEVWLSALVPFGVVKLVQTDGTMVELVNYGTDAKSSITNRPGQD